MSIQTTQKAYIIDGNRGILSTVPIPKLKPDEVLIKNEAVAINPTDWKHIDYVMSKDGAVVGCDNAGIVAAVGDGVTTLKVGDPALGIISGASVFQSDIGAFSEYSIVKEKRVLKPPVELVHTDADYLSFGDIKTWEGASSVPVGIFTTLIALVHWAGIPIEPNSKYNDKLFLVWGGASCLGQSIIQIAKYIGFRVITTASPNNFEFVKEFGAEKVFNYNDSDVVDQIISYTGGRITFAYDAISDGTTGFNTYSTLSKTEESILLVSLPFDEAKLTEVNPKVAIHFPLAYLCLEKKKSFGGPVIDSPDGLFEATDDAADLVNELWKKNPSFIRHMPIRVIKGGLDSINEAIDVVRRGENRGLKVVVKF